MRYLLLLFLLLIPTSADAVWFDSSWAYRVKIEVDPSKVTGSSNLTNFPVYVNLANLPTDFHTNVKSDGCDIRMVESDETTETPFELVSYSSSTDAGELHFKADSLDYAATSTFYLYYGNSGASCYAVTDTYGRNAVWSGYLAVYHLQSLTADSTSNGRTLTNSNSVQSASAKINDGADGTTSNTNRKLGINNDLGVTGNAVSMSVWFRAHSFPGTGARHAVAWQSDNGNIVSQYIGILNNSGTTVVNFARDRHCVGEVAVASSGISTNTWYHAVYTYNNTNVRGYLDGSIVGTSGTATGNGTCAGFYLDGYNLLGNTRNQEYLNGLVDEARITTTVLSADWITTEYNNQSSPSTFYWIGAQETDGGGGGGASTDSGIIWFD